ncbi:2-amino-3-ketobutyrate coenzyme A ligase [Dunaliella salina]|uniref:2-amino-3-ketobutyrate coenzyme A ligase n=1 Tax=Dunaliella salina TaxID=3046 RepID=A0ABQ7H756_DUNSA|nr:2-amino-3-ketobutyrate coenzyme A ligase [Dunaliella salina]|eukprot:KAF5842679.1 2-amino-3-ketobutyrate coenzyme A ligase [Dunaliella salina]
MLARTALSRLGSILWGPSASRSLFHASQSLFSDFKAPEETGLGRPADPMQDTILYPSGFDSNTAFFESILTADDAVISDELNHASIIDGIRLCKAARYRFQHMCMEDLEHQLISATKQGARIKLIATDGVFSMDGDVAPLQDIVQLAKKYNAYTFVDDCHATGFVGPTGRGTDEHWGVQGQIDVISSTLGKALGGGTGGYTTGRKEVVQLLRQRARPYLFSNTLAPAVCGASLKAFELVTASTQLRDELFAKTAYFCQAMREAGFTVPQGWHPIVPIHLGDAALAKQMAASLLLKGVFVVGFSYPVVPRGKARVRVQVSAAHSLEQLNAAVHAFKDTAHELGMLQKTEEAATGVGY